MFGRSIKLLTIFGFPVRLDASWFIVAVLITWSLAAGVFPQQHPGLAAASYWIMGVVGMAGLFLSIVLHELGHALVARRFDLPIREIVLFIFGGVARMEREPPHPRAEFLVAIGGPAVSVALAALFGAAWKATTGGAAPLEVAVVLGYLAVMNAALVGFNLLPAFPLDGGRVLRSVLWGWHGSLRRATRVTSRIGSGFGILFIALGILTFMSGRFVGGMWWGLIGLFLRNASNLSYRQLVLRRALEGERVERFMNPHPDAVPSGTTVASFVEDHLYRYHHEMFPVVENGGRLVGCVTTRGVREVPQESRGVTAVEEIAEACTGENTIDAGADALEALHRMSRGRSRMVVTRGGELAGIITLKDLFRFLTLKMELEEERDAHPHAA